MAGLLENHPLAIVVPAYKPHFLRAALQSIAAQSDQRFNLYICDDASPADIASIAKATLGTRPYFFHRFEKNLGGASLAKHWDRCVALTNEPWVWLFSDDDLMAANCVEALHQFLETEGESADLLRLDVWMVDEHDKIVEPVSFDSNRESWVEFAYAYLMDWRRPCSQRLVFRRAALVQAGGFLDLPQGIGSDAATLISLARHRPIRQIPNAPVFWRHSKYNISPGRSHQRRKDGLRAVCLLVQWLQDLLQSPREHLFEGDEAAFRRALDRFLVSHIVIEGSLAAVGNWKLLSRTRADICHGSSMGLLKYIAMAAVNDSFELFGRMVKIPAGRSTAVSKHAQTTGNRGQMAESKRQR